MLDGWTCALRHLDRGRLQRSARYCTMLSCWEGVLGRVQVLEASNAGVARPPSACQLGN